MKHIKSWKLFEGHVVRHDWNPDFYSLYKGCLEIVSSEVPLAKIYMGDGNHYRIVYNNIFEIFDSGYFPDSEEELIEYFEGVSFKTYAKSSFLDFKSVEGDAGVEEILGWSRRWKALGADYVLDPEWVFYKAWTLHLFTLNVFNMTKSSSSFGQRHSERDLDPSVLSRMTPAQKNAWSYIVNVKVPPSFDAGWVDA